MDPAILPLLCDPITHAPLQIDAQSHSLVSATTGRRYPLRDGIPVFIDQAEVTGPNRKYQNMYDRLAPGYDVVERFYYWLTRKPSFRQDFLKELEIQPGSRVLEVSVGTGANLNALSSRIDLSRTEFFGLDLSWGMLRQCSLNARHQHRNAHLFQAQAERLPFRDNLFDSVFHVGGINFFSGKAAAIREMIRVAKSATKIVIVDETEKVVTGNYQKNPLTKKYFERGTEAVSCPIDLVPPEMQAIEAREIANGKLYCLTFRKP